MNLKLNDTACGLSQKLRQFIGLTHTNIQARQVKRCDTYSFFKHFLDLVWKKSKLAFG
jgi:hypothetical protein